MTTRRRMLLAVLALFASTALAGCDWEPTICVSPQGYPIPAFCV